MKARLKKVTDSKAMVQFSVFIPAITDLPIRINPLCRPLERKNLNTMRIARRVAIRNQGQTPIELSNAVKTHDELLKSIMCIPGIVGFNQNDPYSIQFVYGDLFEPEVIGKTMVQLIQTHFYPFEELDWMEPIILKELDFDF